MKKDILIDSHEEKRDQTGPIKKSISRWTRFGALGASVEDPVTWKRREGFSDVSRWEEFLLLVLFFFGFTHYGGFRSDDWTCAFAEATCGG